MVMPDIFAVDNTANDSTVRNIRNYIRQVAGGLPHMGKEIPISWLHLNSRLKIKKNKDDQFCKFNEILELARDPDINITDRHTLAMVLTFLNDRGDIIFFDEPSLRDDVTLQPQVMIDVFKTIITVPEYQQDRQTDPEVRKMWERLEQVGVLSDRLLTKIWEKKDRQQNKPFLLRHKSFLKALMEKFYLICNATPVGDASDEAQQEEIYFVPALLSCERDNAKLYPGNMHVCPQALYFVFSEKFLPSGMFCRLQALCVRRFGLQDSRVYAGCARFPTDYDEQSFVLIKVNHILKVELLSSSDVFTEGLRVRKFLSSALFEIKEKWIPCIQYTLCCSTRQEDGDEPAFRALETDDRPVKRHSGIPSAFRNVWMTGSSKPHRTENSGGDGPAILHPTGDPINMRTIGPVLDTMDLGKGLSLDQCDRTRSKLTPRQRVEEMVSLVEHRYLLGAAVEMCCPEFADCFLREKRGKELVILHTDDYTQEFVSPLQTAASELGFSCHSENIGPTVSITEKAVDRLFNTNNRMIILVISPQALHHRHWSNLDYEFPVRNEKLLLPILLYPQGSRDRIVRVLQQRAPVLCSLTPVEIEMEGRPVSEERLQEIVQKVMTDDERDFHQILEGIVSQLDKRDVRLLLRLWCARTGSKDRPELETPADLTKAMIMNGYITAGDLGMLQIDMIAAGISLPVILRDIPDALEELNYTRTAEAVVGPMGGEVEISGFFKVVVPPGALGRDTTVTVSTVDVAAILRDDEGVNWISGYPWSLGEDACPRELLDQVLFSPAVDVSLHGAQLNGPVEVQTWRPPGSEGMTCLLLKHHDEEGWTDITASTLPRIDSDRLSMLLHSFSIVDILWAPVNLAIAVKDAVLAALSSRTLDCLFSAYIKSSVEEMEFHVVCTDQCVDVNEYQYRQGFKQCGYNEATSPLYNDDMIKVDVSAWGSQKSTEPVKLRAKLCKESGQKIQMLLKRPNRNPAIGEVDVRKSQPPDWLSVCKLTFREEDETLPGNCMTTQPLETSRPEAGPCCNRTEAGAKGDGNRPPETTQPGVGPSGIRTEFSAKGSGRKPVVLLINGEYSHSHGGVSAIHCQMAGFLASKEAVVYSTVLDATEDDKNDAAADGVQLIFPTTSKGDNRKPSLDWLTWEHQTRYPNLPSNVDFIVGHVNITSRAARLIKEQRLPDAKLVQVTHEIPEDTSQYKGNEQLMSIGEESDSILEDLRHADVIFSIGPLVYDYYTHQTKQLERQHFEFLPKPCNVFSEMHVTYVNTKTKSVLSVGMEKGLVRLKGYDLSAKAMTIVLDQVPNTRWRVCSVSPEDFPESKKAIQAKVEKLHFTPLKYTTQKELSEEMRRADVVLMPSRAEPFGLIGLEAIAAGVPVLVSNKSGLAWFLKRQDPEFDRLIVDIEDDDDEDAKTLAKRIIKVLKDGSREFQAARNLKEKLLASKYWDASHSKFLEAFGL